jgi:DNA-binding HxlR family transcriptional regulator
MKREDDRSDCPINYGVESLGDSWSLLLVRDMAMVGKQTFGEFSDSDERIGTSVLAQRLAGLERRGIIEKAADPEDGRKAVYRLTETGLALLPLLYELQQWGLAANPATDSHPAWHAAAKLPRDEVLGAWTSAVRSGSSFYFGERSVVGQLSLPF